MAVEAAAEKIEENLRAELANVVGPSIGKNGVLIADELADPLFASPTFQKNLTGMLANFADNTVPQVLRKCLPDAISILLQRFEVKINKMLDDRLPAAATSSPPEASIPLTRGSFAQLQCLNSTTLNGKIGYITEVLDENRFGVYLPDEEKTISIAGPKLRPLSFGELADLQSNARKWKPEYCNRIDKARREADLKAARKVVGNIADCPLLKQENKEFFNSCRDSFKEVNGEGSKDWLQHIMKMNNRDMDHFLNSEDSDDSVEDSFKGCGSSSAFT